MQCKLDRNKIKEAVVEAVKERIEATQLFTIEENSILANRIPEEGLEPTSEQIQKSIEALQYKDDVKGLYNGLFEQDPVSFLREIAKQINSSESEAISAIDIAGQKLADIAVEIFPNEGLLEQEKEIIKNINKEFKDDVLMKVSLRRWEINVSDDLIDLYLMSQKGAGDMIWNRVREKHLSRYSSTSLNLLSSDLWINNPILEDPTVKKLIAFAKKINPNFRIEVVKDLDVNAVALIRDNIILVREGAIIDELPEEVSHFFFELLPDDHPLKKEMMEKIVNLPIYSQTYQQYKDNPFYQKNGKPDINKIKREASAKQIGEYVKAAYRNEADAKYGKKRGWLREIIHQIFKFLRKMFHINSAPIYTESIVDLNSPFMTAAQTILNEDISALNLQKVPSLYDSIFFSQVENEIPEGFEASDLVKTFHQFNKVVRKQIIDIFYKFIEKENMQGLKELTNDPNNKDVNKIWGIISSLEESSKILSNLEENNMFDLLTLSRAAQVIATAYHEMEEIPKAITTVLRRMSKEKTEDQLINNVTELQTYLRFSDTFRNITNEFVRLLGHIRANYPTKGIDNIYDRMQETMGSTESQFRVTDELIIKKLQDHVVDLVNVAFEEHFKKYIETHKAQIDKITSERLKKDIAKKITSRILTTEQLRNNVTGVFPAGKHIKDMSQLDYGIFMLSSPTLVGDPFVATVVNYYVDKFTEYQFKGQRESLQFANTVLPIMKELSEKGVGWYEANNDIQTVQSFYDKHSEDNKTEKRTFLAPVNRFDFQFEKRRMNAEITALYNEISNLQAKFLTDTLDEEEKTVIKKDIEDKLKTLREKREDKDKWMRKWSHLPFTQEFYDIQDKLKASRGDSATFARIKEIDLKLFNLQMEQDIYIVMDQTMNNEDYDHLTHQIALLQNEKLDLQKNLPEVEKEIYEKINDLYEIDEVNSARIRQQHRNQWIRKMTSLAIETGVTMSKEDIVSNLEERYDILYKLSVPTQEFYDERARIFDEISKLTVPFKGFSNLEGRLQELKELEKKFLRPFREKVRKEISLVSMKHLSMEKTDEGIDIPLIQSLKSLEEEMDMIKRKISVYSRIVASTIKEEDKKLILSTLEILTAFTQVINNSLSYTAKDVIKAFKNIIPFTTSQAEQILDAINQSYSGNNTAFANLINLDVSGASPDIQKVFKKLNLESPSIVSDFENQIFKSIKKEARLSEEEKIQIGALFNQLEGMYSNSMTLQYTIVLKEFLEFYRMYVNDSSFDFPNKSYHHERLKNLSVSNIVTIEDVENMMGAGLFEAVISYMGHVERELFNGDPEESTRIANLRDFYEGLHKKKTTWVDGEEIVTYTPLRYAKRPMTDHRYTKIEYPAFLTRNKVKDTYRTDKIKETDERVLAGTHKPTVDINGEWLPIEREDSPFWNKEYANLKNAKDEVGKLKFKLLETIKQEYLKKQEEYLPEGERLDLVIPPMGLDKIEQKKLLITNVKAGWDYIRNAIPFTKNKSIPEEEQNYLEEIEMITMQNRDIYTGEIIATRDPKLVSKRRLPLVRTSKDAISSVTMFIEDVNEFTAKNVVAPIMKSFADVIKYAHERNPKSNVLRSTVLDDLHSTKILGEKPKNLANNPILAKALAAVNKLVTLRLLGDPLGAAINLTSGAINTFIEANFSKSEHAVYLKAGWKAKDWLYYYDRDFYRQSNWGLQTQLIALFNMIPDTLHVSHQINVQALFANIRSKLMAPRSESEKLLGIHLGLTVVMAEPIIHNDKAVTIEDIYELDPVTNLIRLKKEYSSLSEDWNPDNGKKVRMLRKKLMQRYTLFQGNFYKQNQSYASTTAVGRTFETLKRWFMTGVLRRYQPEVIDLHIGGTRKGYHLAMLHMLRNFVKSIFTGDTAAIHDYWNVVLEDPKEKEAIRKSLAEILYVMVFGAMVLFVMGYDDDDEDKNKKMREMAYLKQLILLIFMRVQGELGTFIPLPVAGLGYMEMKRAIIDPFGLPRMTVDNMAALVRLTLEHMFSVFGADFDDDLYYQKRKPYNYWAGGLGAFKDKGDSKWWAVLLNTIGYTGYTFEPGEYIKMLNQMQNRLK